MPVRERVDVEKGECLVALEDLHRGNLACGLLSNAAASLGSIRLTLDDLAEDARHAPIST